METTIQHISILDELYKYTIEYEILKMKIQAVIDSNKMKTYRIIAPVSIKNIPDVPKGISIPIVFPMGDKVCVFIDTKFSIHKLNDLIIDLLPDYNDNITIEEVDKTVPVQQLYNEALIKYIN